MRKHNTGGITFNIFNAILLSAIAISMIYPFIHLLAIALSSPGAVLSQSVGIIPKGGVTFETFKQVIESSTMTRTMGNTVFITVVGTLVNMILTILMAYPLSRRYIVIRGFIMKIIIFTMLFNGGMIPNYYLISKLGLIDSYWALILPGAISAFNMIILISFFQTIPSELEDAAHIDGAGDFKILIQIVIPLSLAGIATISLFYAVAKWNTFMNAILYINSMKKYPLQVVLRQIILQNEAISSSTDDILSMPPESKKAASIFFSVVPILCAYPFLQKYFVKGVMIGAIKG